MKRYLVKNMGRFKSNGEHYVKSRSSMRLGPFGVIDWISDQSLDWALGKTEKEVIDYLWSVGKNFHTTGWRARAGEVMPDSERVG